MEKDNGNLVKEIELLRERIADLQAVKFEFKKAEEVAKEAKELSENIVDAVRDPLIVMDANLKILLVNKPFYNAFKVIPDETIGKFIYDLGNRQWNIPKLRKLLEEIIPNNASFDGYVIEHDFPNIGKRIMVLNARRIPRPPQTPRIILLAIEDITDIDKLRMSFERMAECGLFTEVANKSKTNIVELEKEVNALLLRFGEKLKYNDNVKKP